MCFLKFFRTNIRLKCRRVRLWQEFFRRYSVSKDGFKYCKRIKRRLLEKNAQGEDLEAFLGFYLKNETRTQLADCSLGGTVCIFNICR